MKPPKETVRIAELERALEATQRNLQTWIGMANKNDDARQETERHYQELCKKLEKEIAVLRETPVSGAVKPTVIVGRNAIALVHDDARRVVLVGPVESVGRGLGAALYTRGEALAMAAALEAVAGELPIE